MDEEAFKKLRAPFPATEIGKLPRVTCKDCSDRRVQCAKHKKQECKVCKAYISTAHIHLDFVGHAGVTDRLLHVDPDWVWEPVAFAPDGAPLVRKEDGQATLWIRMTVAGVTRYGVGIAPGNSIELEKQLISDAIRNAAMRFGVALDLWSKEDLQASEDSPTPASTSARPAHRDVAMSQPGVGDAVPPAEGSARPAAGGAAPQLPMPPCEWSLEDVAAMNPPALMKALKYLGVNPVGKADDWRAQLGEIVAAQEAAS